MSTTLLKTLSLNLEEHKEDFVNLRNSYKYNNPYE